MKKNGKYILITIFVIFSFIFIMPNALADEIDYTNLCANSGMMDAMRLLGYLIYAIKIIVPIIIIVLGMIDYFKAITSDDEKAISKATSSLIRRLIAGIAVFFIPTIVFTLLNFGNLAGGMQNVDNTEFGSCTKCLLKLDC